MYFGINKQVHGIYMHIHAYACKCMHMQSLLEWVQRLGSKCKKAKKEADAGAAAVGSPGWNAFDII
jgi:hypothetical protein